MNVSPPVPRDFMKQTPRAVRVNAKRPTPGLPFKARQREVKMRGLLSGFYVAALASCYLPISLTTPMGFLSPVDLVMIVWFPFAFIGAFVDDAKVGRGIPVILLSAAAFAAVVTTQLLAEGANNISPVIKFGIFLVVTPLTMQFCNFGAEVLNGRRRPSRVIAIAGSLLSIFTLYKVVTHQAQGSGDVYYVVMFGSLINKNWLGAILTTSVIAAMIEWVHGKRWPYLMLVFVQILAILIIGARASTIGSALAASLIYLYLNPEGRKGLLKRLVMLAILGVIAAIAIAVVFTAQLSRLQQLQQTDTSQVNASNSRLLLWAFAIEKIKQSPLIGWGYGTFHYEGVGWLNGMYEPHDNILQITYANGLIGLVLFILIIILSLRKNNGEVTRLIRVAGCAYLAETLVDIIWTRGDGHLFWLLLYSNAFFTSTERPNSPQMPAEVISDKGV